MTAPVRIRSLGTLLLTIVLAAPAAAEGPGSTEKTSGNKPAPAVAEPLPRITLGHDTTRITGPLRPDGSVAYVAALDQHFQKGVTTQNNAAVLLWKATGPAELRHSPIKDEYFRKLGIPALPEKGDYFITLQDYLKNMAQQSAKPGETPAPPDQKVWDQQGQCMKRPWPAKEYPLFAAWLETNQKPLALAIEASRRPRRYDPIVGGDHKMVMDVLLPALQKYRQIGAALCMRAMLRLEQGQVEQAWDDLLASHRLARLAGQGLTLIDALVGIATDTIACAGDQALVQSGRLTAPQARKIQEALATLPPLPCMADKLDVAERFMFLDAVQEMARRGPSFLHQLAEDQKPSSTTEHILQSVTDWLAQVFLDWDLILRTGNSWYDRLVMVERLPTRAQRKAALGQIEMDVRTMRARVLDPAFLDWSDLADPPRAVSERLAQVLVSLLVPAVIKVADAEDRAQMQIDLDCLALALAAYHADHGSYPPKLGDLVPRYLSQVPRDMFSNKDLIYHLEGPGFLLYSVGVNGKDDGGRSYNEEPGKNYDDLVVRVPAKPTEKKP